MSTFCLKPQWAGTLVFNKDFKEHARFTTVNQSLNGTLSNIVNTYGEFLGQLNLFVKHFADF